jgi:hypothetical protein
MLEWDENLWFKESLLSEATDGRITKGPASVEGQEDGLLSGPDEIEVWTSRPLWRWLAASESSGFQGEEAAKFLLVRLGFQFVIPLKLYEDGFRVVWARCSALIQGDAHVAPWVIDLFPKDLYGGGAKQVKVTLSPKLRFGSLEASMGGATGSIDIGRVEPVIVGYPGRDEREPYWEISPKEVDLLGVRTFWLSLAVPPGCREIVLSAKAEAEVRRRRLKYFLGPKLQRWSERPNIRISAQIARGEEKNDEGKSRLKDTSPKDKPIKVLFLSSSPVDAPVLRIDREIRRIREALKQTRFGDLFVFDLRGAVQAGDLQDLLFTSQPDIVQFSGHGTKRSEILLEDEAGNRRPVPPQALAKLFSLCSPNLRCVILNACYSESQARAIAEHIDCVIGMSSAIKDSAAADFSRGFFQALGSGTDLQTAFERGRLEMDLLGDDQPGAPVLLSRRPQITLT